MTYLISLTLSDVILKGPYITLTLTVIVKSKPNANPWKRISDDT